MQDIQSKRSTVQNIFKKGLTRTLLVYFVTFSALPMSIFSFYTYNELQCNLAHHEAVALKDAMIGAWCATIFLAVIFSVLIARHVVKPLTQLTEATGDVESDDFAQKMGDMPDNEIGVLAESLKLMSKSMIQTKKENMKREWFNTGKSDLSNCISGIQGIEMLALNILEHLSAYVGAEIGRLYIADDDAEFLELCTGFACAESRDMDLIPVGEGFLGQAVTKPEIVYKNDLPDNYLKISSSLGEAQVRSILIMPLYFDNHLVGAIELGAISDISDEQIEYAKTVTEQISTALHSVIGREMIHALLDESTHQAKLLRENEARLEATNLELEQTSKYKSEFLANMSHEIRTPMNGVIGMTKLLAETPLDNNQTDYVQCIQSSGDALLTIINDILDLSKIEAGKLEIEEIDFNIQSMITDFSKMISFKAKEKGLELNCYIAADLPAFLKGDPGRLRQILTNLTGNAIKFTSDGKVEISCKVNKVTEEVTELYFAVSDTGIGIPKDKHEMLFEQFTQADGSTTRNYEGTGLGLAISKQLAEMMGGEIGIESSEGKGSTFWFTVSLKPSEEVTSRGQASETGVPIGNSTTSTKADFSQTKVLLAEDNHINQQVALGVLNKLGVQTDIASNGKQALDMLNKSNYDLVFMDMQMPVMDGITATREIRSQNNSIPIIAMTANAMPEDREQCLEAGMNDYISKPIEPQIVRSVLMHWVADTLKSKDEVKVCNEQDEKTSIFNYKLFMKKMMDDKEMVHEILQAFVETTPAMIAELSTSINEADANEINIKAHSLRGSAAQLICTDLSDQAKEIEFLARNNKIDEIKEIVGKLHTKYTEAEKEIRKFIKSS